MNGPLIITTIPKRMGIACLALVALLCMTSGVRAEQSIATQIRAMTGARTKIAWIRATGGTGHPMGGLAEGETNNAIWQIVVLDTDDNGGAERYLTEKCGSYSHIEITPNGKRILWSGDGVWVSDWDGRHQKQLLDHGMTVGVAEDPVGTDWVYVKEAAGTNGVQPVYRYQIDHPGKKELVWDKNNTNDKWEIARDGKFACTRWNGGPVGIVAMPNGEEKDHMVSAGGCTPGMAGDLSIVTHMKAMGHSGIFVYNRDGSDERYIDFVSQAPGAKDVPLGQYWWCNFARYDKRFYSFSGPHGNMQYSRNGSNIYLCRFNDAFDNFDKWLIVTDNPALDTQSYVWIDSSKAPPPWEGLEIESALESQMGASLQEPVVVTIKNNTAKDWKGRVTLTLEEGLKAEHPEGVEIIVAKGATNSVSQNIIKDPALNAGGFRSLAADVSVANSKGHVIDWSRKWFKVGCPVTLAQAVPAAFNEEKQPVPVMVKNLAGKPVSGKISLELLGPSKIGPIEQDFGPIPGGKEVAVSVMVPNLKIRGYNWQAKFIAKANGLETTLAAPLVVERKWLLLGPFPNSVKDPWDQDFGFEKEILADVDTAKTFQQTVPPTDDYSGWGGLKTAWTDYYKTKPTMKWTPSPALRSIAGGQHAESAGYLNLYDYYQDIAKLPNQMAV